MVGQTPCRLSQGLHAEDRSAPVARAHLVFSASVLGLGAAVASRGAVFVSNILLAHSLTVHDFGLFSYAYVTALNLGLFLATGFRRPPVMCFR